MKFDPPIFRLLVINLCLIFALTTGEIEFYNDVEPEPPETDVRLKQLERYLESHDRPRFFRRDYTPPHRYPPVYEDDYNIGYRQREKDILEAIAENPRILDILEKDKLNYINSRPRHNNLNYQKSLNNERPYINVNLNPPSSVYQIPKLKNPYKNREINDNYYFDNARNYPVQNNALVDENYEDNIDTSLENLQERLLSLNAEKQYKPLLNDKFIDRVPEFTYYFNEPTFKELQNTFASKPNDPRYYEKENLEHITKNEEKKKIIDQDKTIISKLENNSTDFKIVHPLTPTEETTDKQYASENDDKTKFTILEELMPEPHRRAERDPMITLKSTRANNDIYFIAIVAGCSAAAMFAIVLISLTWCRLQRGVKAAADIEYPAYGVTGPNKDISPSGDQRLAHSAQMYHFQHQKQQIIAMEKSAASRDPGSVSEAESDEENEEGDYTVYECPGLAPAGEVEVKNPMFHDDPTPATPPQNHKDEDHRH